MWHLIFMLTPDTPDVPEAPDHGETVRSSDAQNPPSSFLAGIRTRVGRMVRTALLDLKIRVIYGNQGDIHADIDRDRAVRLSWFEQDKHGLLGSLDLAEANIRKWEREHGKKEQNATMDDLEGDLGDLLIARDDVYRKLRHLDATVRDLEESASRMLCRVRERATG